MRSSARLLHPDELTAFHAVRSDLYLASFELLRMPPSDASLANVRCALSGDVPHRRGNGFIAELFEAMATSSPERAAFEYAQVFVAEPPLQMRCGNAGCRWRGEAFAAVSVLAGEERVSELKVLGLLANRTLEALGSGCLPEASILTDVQGRFLGHHAASCLSQLVTSLRKGGPSLYSRVGAALGWLIEEDLRLLGQTSRRPP